MHPSRDLLADKVNTYTPGSLIDFVEIRCDFRKEPDMNNLCFLVSIITKLSRLKSPSHKIRKRKNKNLSKGQQLIDEEMEHLETLFKGKGYVSITSKYQAIFKELHAYMSNQGQVLGIRAMINRFLNHVYDATVMLVLRRNNGDISDKTHLIPIAKDFPPVEDVCESIFVEYCNVYESVLSYLSLQIFCLISCGVHKVLGVDESDDADWYIELITSSG